MKTLCTLGVCCLAVVLLPQKTAAQNYTFTNMVDNTGPFSGFLGSAALNNLGVVAFSSETGPGGRGVFRTDGVTVTTIADETGPLLPLYFLDINDAGQVAYVAVDQFLYNRTGAYRGDGTSVVKIADAGTLPHAPAYAVELPFVEDLPSINDSGTVAFVAYGTTSAESYSILTGNGANLTAIAAVNYYFFTHLQSPAINNLGKVAFRGTLDDSVAQGIYIGNGGTTSTVIDSSGPYDSFGGTAGVLALALNDQGVVATAATRDEGGVDVLRIDGASVDVVAGPYENVYQVGLNNAGDVAFWAEFEPNTFGIFTGPDPLADKVIADGDPLFGSTANLGADFNDWMDGPNEAGQIAFRYALADGRVGIALATPAVEPLCPGDYNDNGELDAADYTAWRDAMEGGGSLVNDPTPGVDEDDFLYWRDHFGETFGGGGGSAAAVPEPNTLAMLFAVVIFGLAARRHRQQGLLFLACDMNRSPNKRRRRPLAIVMSNSFGFGGHNASIIAGAA